jgi:hypothetical protein
MSELRTNRIVPRDGMVAGAAGGIIQLVSITKTDPFNTQSTSYTDVTGLSATINIQSASSKVFVLITACGNTNGSKGYGQIVRGSTPIAIGNADGSKIRATFDMNNAGSGNRGQSYVAQTLDAPGVTGNVTYKLQVRHENGSGDVFINRIADTNDSAVNGRYSSTITLMEFSA